MPQDLKMETFITVCDYRNITRAANVLGLTQPAVSRQMKNLEEHYGVSLFRYEGKKLFLTAAGEILYRYAKVARSDEIRIQEKLKEQTAKTLRLGSTPTPGEFMIRQILSAYLREYPISEVHMTIHNTEALLEKLDLGEIDLAVVEGNFPKKEYEYLFFSNQNYVPVCSKGQEVTGGAIENLLSHRLIVREPGSGNREILEYSLMRHNLLLSDFAGKIETNDIKVQKALVGQGCGIAFLFETVIENEESLKVIPIDDFPLQHEINLVWRKNSIFQEEFLELARYFAEHTSIDSENSIG